MAKCPICKSPSPHTGREWLDARRTIDRGRPAPAVAFGPPEAPGDARFPDLDEGLLGD